MRHVVIACVLGLTAVIAAPPAFASGSEGGYGGSRGYGDSDYNRLPPRDPAAEAYSRGKWMVSKRIACKKCLYPTGVKDTPTAIKIASSVKAGEFDLKPNERQLVLYYLSRRFGS